MAMTEENYNWVELECLCLRHADSCERPRCFVKNNLRVQWFHRPNLDAILEIPDSYEEGHGLSLTVPGARVSKQLSNQGHVITCSALSQSCEIVVRCTCRKPVPHLCLVDAACYMYNLN